MAYEMLVGLEVTDDHAYQTYRENMAPILKRYGGGFHYDFTVDQVLMSETHNPINRVFTIYFKDEQAKNDFFHDPEYLQIKAKYFESSVKATTIIASYNTDN
ncbi:DUF1330 domain-containing protein [Litoribacillus peritrichatus]|uniref:DUF1330 domain-containing protein n=1 Tax=Litoribacillus peritrichatus TaxID=718191 RepID=A0ABP7N3R2_9GAMM